MSKDEEFEYRGRRVRVQVREISGEIDSGVYVSTAAFLPPGQPGGGDGWQYLEKNHQSIHLSADAALKAAIARARKALERLAGP
ncbi:hypothetical protein V8Z80_14460 [Orrella sp. JC864]|uniref:hypothetical protein n=1 Tax=Orrella sp. JC864 TaxID=3120298 RepID=UPI0030081FCD